MKKITLLLTAVFVLSAAALYAQDGEFWITTNGTRLARYNGDAAKVVIPAGVTQIAFEAFKNKRNLASVTIPDSVTTIGDRAFDGCTGLTSVNIPANSSLTSIGEWAFSGCSNLTSITIPAGVTSIAIEKDPFVGCTMLARIIVDERNTVYSSIDGVLFNKAKTTLIKYPRGKQGNPYVIPDSVTYIGESAFGGCWNLTSINIPDRVTIGEWAFNSSGLTWATIGSASIGDRAFMSCESLASVTLLRTVTSIGVRAFQGCKFTNITIPSSVRVIGSNAFQNCPLTPPARAEIERLFGKGVF
jgi:hypothetical protein